MFESEDIHALNKERQDMNEYLDKKYAGVIPLKNIVCDLALEIKRLRLEMNFLAEEIVSPSQHKKGVKNG